MHSLLPWIRSSPLRLVVALLLAMSVASVAPAAQPRPQQLQYEVTCPGCRISMTRIASIIGRPSDSVVAGGRARIARDSRGRFYLSSDDMVRVLVYDSTGTLMRTIGRDGSGPGEFGSPASVLSGIEHIAIGIGDTVHVFHSRSRIEVFSPSYAYIRSVPTPSGSRTGQAVVANGSYILGASFRSSELIGYPYHIVSPTGGVRLSFGGDGGAIGPGEPGPLPGWVFPAPGLRTFWTLSGTYQMREWAMDGRLINDLEIRGVPWYVPASGPYAPGRRPPSLIGPGGVDSLGRFWIAGESPTGAMVSGRWVSSGSERRMEVVDPNTSSIILSQEVPLHLRIISGTNIGYTVSEGPDGFANYHIYRVGIIANR